MDIRSDQQLDHMTDGGYFHWALAGVMVASTCFSIFTGRIRYRGWPLIDRDENPNMFWTHIAGWTIVAVALVATAIF
jgi:hypothetical protein